MRIYKPGDRLTLKIEEIEVVVEPLTFREKSEILSKMGRASAKGNAEEAFRNNFETLRYAIKDVTGFTNEDGSPWRPTFDEDGRLDWESLDVLLNMTVTEPVLNHIAGFLQGIPKKLPEGVTLVESKKKPMTSS